MFLIIRMASRRNARNASSFIPVTKEMYVATFPAGHCALSAVLSAVPCIAVLLLLYFATGSKKPPYVCNNCNQIRTCSHDFYFYRAHYAHDLYNEIKVSSRSGINQTPESLEQLDQLVSPFLLKGQPLSHIYASNQHLIDCSIRTLYNYIDHGYFTAINLDLPRKVRYKKRRKTRKAPENTGYRENRTYHHFEKYLEEYPDTNVVELDVVEGSWWKI